MFGRRQSRTITPPYTKAMNSLSEKPFNLCVPVRGGESASSSSTIASQISAFTINIFLFREYRVQYLEIKVFPRSMWL